MSAQSSCIKLALELTSPTDCKCVYKDCIASLKRFLKLSLYHLIVHKVETNRIKNAELTIYGPSSS